MWRLLTGELKLSESRRCRQGLTHWIPYISINVFFFKVENYVIQVEKLKQCLEDITSVCILEGFQKQVLPRVCEILSKISGHSSFRSIWWWWIVCWRSLGGQRLALLLETGLSTKLDIFHDLHPIYVENRQPVMTSPHFIQQYFTSFCEDPVLKSLEKVGVS